MMLFFTVSALRHGDFRFLVMMPTLVAPRRYPLRIVIQGAVGALITVVMTPRALATARERFAYNALDRLVRPEKTRAGPSSENEENEQESADDIGEDVKAN